MVNNNVMFDKVYNKVADAIENKLKTIAKLKVIGASVDYDTIKILNNYINYLEYVRDSQYRYFYINGLTGISNHVNKL